MTNFQNKIALFLAGLSTISLMGCSANSNEIITPTSEPSENTLEQTTNNNDATQTLETEDTPMVEEIIAPTKEEVLEMRTLALEGMSEEEIDRLTQNIKVANLCMEEAYMYDDLFGKLEDENHLYWNYFDQKGDIQIGWEYDGTSSSMKEICEKENLTNDEFYAKYGTPVMVYNRFDANNFIELLDDMNNSVQNEDLKNDIQYIIHETRLAQETHNVEHANNIYKALHDMDYFLLRYGIEDVGQFTRDNSVVSKYYGVLSIYSK